MNEKIIEILLDIFRKEKRYLTLSEIYLLFTKYCDVTEYSDFTAVVRSNLYRRCENRDLNDNSLPYLFYSLYEKRKNGQKYGLYEWKDIQYEIYSDLNKLEKKNEKINDFKKMNRSERKNYFLFNDDLNSIDLVLDYIENLEANYTQEN